MPVLLKDSPLKAPLPLYTNRRTGLVRCRSSALHPIDVHHPLIREYLVENPIGANSPPPHILLTLHFHNVAGIRVCHQIRDGCENPFGIPFRDSFELFAYITVNE